jgi:antitoxin component YwqK of YwqJK toxin-antitoxin module
MTKEEVFEIMKFIGTKVPKYELKSENGEYVFPITGQIMNKDYEFKNGLFQENKIDKVVFNSGYTGIAYSYTDGYLKGKTTYVNGLMEGPFETYHKNGKLLAKGSSKKNNMNGPYQSFLPNGELNMEGDYRNHKKVGDWNYYYDTGQLYKILSHDDNGSILKSKMFYRNGKIKQVELLVNGQLDGDNISYYENGNLETHRVYQNGKLKDEKLYDEEGRQLRRGLFNNIVKDNDL